MTTKTTMWLVTALVLSGCSLLGNCEEFGENLGKLELSEDAKAIYPTHYQSMDRVRFMNESGEVLSYSITNRQSTGRTIYEEIGVCDVEPYDRIYSYYETEEITTLLDLSDRDGFIVNLGFRMNHGLVEVLEAFLVEDNTLISEIALADPFDDNSLDPFSNNTFDTLYQELTLRGRSFEQVYESSLTGNGDIRFYYSIPVGFIGIIKNDELWLLEE